MGGGANAAGGMWGPSSAYLSPVDTWEDSVKFYRTSYLESTTFLWYTFRKIGILPTVSLSVMCAMSVYRWGK